MKLIEKIGSLKLKFENIYKNITGFSCPIFGIQWNPPTPEVTVAQNLIIYLENKRVLFNPTHIENAQHCISSVTDIRNKVTKSLQELSTKSHLAKPLRRMRKSLIDFCNKLGHPLYSSFEYPVQKSMMERELFKLREKFGILVSEIAIAYGLDVDDKLASIIPFNFGLNEL